MALKTAGRNAIADGVREWRYFIHGNVSGTRECSTFGQLPQEYWASARNAQYLIYSYQTPIAWVDSDGVWFVPDVRYSVTTTNHQSAVKSAIDK